MSDLLGGSQLTLEWVTGFWNLFLVLLAPAAVQGPDSRQHHAGGVSALSFKQIQFCNSNILMLQVLAVDLLPLLLLGGSQLSLERVTGFWNLFLVLLALAAVQGPDIRQHYAWGLCTIFPTDSILQQQHPHVASVGSRLVALAFVGR